MGRGGYIGGGTIVYPGGYWHKGSGGEEGTDSKPLKLVRPPPGDDKKTGTKSTSKSTGKGKKGKSIDIEALKKTHMHAVLHAHAAGKPFPAPPKKAKEKILIEIAKSGGEMNWAKLQPGYAKAAQKLSNTAAAAASPRVLQDTESAVQSSSTQMREKLLQEMIELKSQKIHYEISLQKINLRIAEILLALGKNGGKI